jgi:preprotein translocase subunit SecB
MLTEINLTALASIEKNFEDKKELEKIILIKIPTEVYPTLYETFIYLFKQAGIKDINIEKNINFEKMYNERKKSQL